MVNLVIQSNDHRQSLRKSMNIDPLLFSPEGREDVLRETVVSEWFDLGKKEIKNIMNYVESHGGYLNLRYRALDFACGIGETTRALSPYFSYCYGVEFTESLAKKARELNGDCRNCVFLSNTEKHFRLFPDDYFDFIHVNASLQYFEKKKVVKSFIAEFVRTLAPRGILVFQLPCFIPLKQRVQPNKSLNIMLKLLGFNKGYIVEKLKLHPVKSIFFPENEIVLFLNLLGAKVIDIKFPFPSDSGIQTRTYFVTKTKMWY